MVRHSFRLILSRGLFPLIFLFTSGVRAQGEEPIITTPPIKVIMEKKIADAGVALKTGPVCDEKLLDELSMHIKGMECLNYFDHGCWRFYAAISGVMGSAAGLAGAAGTLVEKNAANKLSYSKHKISKNIRLGLESKQFELKYKQMVDPKDMWINGKRVRPEQVRLVALKSLERLASDASLPYAQAARKAASKAVTVSAARSGVLLYAGAGAASAGVGFFIMSVLDSTPAGDCNDNGLAYIDYRPRSDGENGCEMSFAPTGNKVRNFFSLTREKQLAVMMNDNATCEYYNVMNNALKGKLLSEIEIMNQVTFSEMPSCAAGKKGVGYSLKLTDLTFNIDSKSDPETQKIRSLKMTRQDPVKNKPIEFVNVHYQDNEDGSRPYRVESEGTWGSKVDQPFEDFLLASTRNSKYENAVKAMNASQLWTPIVASCCTETEAEACWRKKLPGLDAAVDARTVAVKKAEKADASHIPGKK